MFGAYGFGQSYLGQSPDIDPSAAFVFSILLLAIHLEALRAAGVTNEILRAAHADDESLEP